MGFWGLGMRTLLLWVMVATAVMTARQANADEYISPSLFISSSGQFASVSNGGQVQVSGPFDPTSGLDATINATLNVNTNFYTLQFNFNAGVLAGWFASGFGLSECGNNAPGPGGCYPPTNQSTFVVSRPEILTISTSFFSELSPEEFPNPITGSAYIDLQITEGSGFYFSPVGSVPEPSTWAMLLIGFAWIGFASYKRKAPHYGTLAT
jgi:hypothetical protein